MNITFDKRIFDTTSFPRDPDYARAETLINFLNHNDCSIRKDAALVLGRLHDRLAVDPLINALKRSDESSFLYAIKSLGQLGDPRAIEPLKKAAKDKRPNIKLAANWALSRLGVSYSNNARFTFSERTNKTLALARQKQLGEVDLQKRIRFLEGNNFIVFLAVQEFLERFRDLKLTINRPRSTEVFYFNVTDALLRANRQDIDYCTHLAIANLCLIGSCSAVSPIIGEINWATANTEFWTILMDEQGMVYEEGRGGRLVVIGETGERAIENIVAGHLNVLL